jgi:hypothetical protein
MAPEKDLIGRLFAQLTVQLEDAIELATEGQNRNASRERRANLSMRLRRRLGRAVRTIDALDVKFGSEVAE